HRARKDRQQAAHEEGGRTTLCQMFAGNAESRVIEEVAQQRTCASKQQQTEENVSKHHDPMQTGLVDDCLSGYQACFDIAHTRLTTDSLRQWSLHDCGLMLTPEGLKVEPASRAIASASLE